MTVSVDAVVYYRVSNATVSVANVENAHHSTRLLAQTTLRNILGTKDLHEILGDRETISGSMQAVCALSLFAPSPPHRHNAVFDAPTRLIRDYLFFSSTHTLAESSALSSIEGEGKKEKTEKEKSERIAARPS